MQNVKQFSSLQNTTTVFPEFLKWMMYFYFFISYFEPFLNGVIGSVLKYYIFILIVLILLNTKYFRIKTYHYMYIFWFLYKCTSLIWTLDYEMFRTHIVSHIGMLLWLFCLTAINLKQEMIEGFIMSSWIGSISIGTLSLFFSSAYHGYVEERQVLTLFGQQCDPNNLAAYLAVAYAVSLYWLLSGKKHILLRWSGLFVNAFAMFKTGSRTGLVTLALVTVLMLLMSFKKASFTLVLRYLFLFGIVLLVLYFIIENYIPQNIFDRLFEFDTYEGGSNRDFLWENAWGLYTQGLNPFFGAGWGAYFNYNGVGTVPHNTYLGMLCDVGIIGVVLFFGPIAKAVKSLISDNRVLPVCLMIIGAVPALFIESINKRFFWNAIILLMIFYNRNTADKFKEEQFKKRKV